MMNLLDAKERDRALDPSTSFIIQAPAGSGKTELITQRFLVLLNTVMLPEEILAITFTKKSANEMRARIINTLKTAQFIQKEPEAEHAKKTWHLAKRVLERDNKLTWHLLSNPNRLRIQTIDSFNASLTKQLPILSQFGAAPLIADYPIQLYQEAVDELLTHLEEEVYWSDAIATLLKHLDNDINKVKKQLILMLSKRDQWLPHIAHGKETDHKSELQLAIYHIIQDALKHAHSLFPRNRIADLINVAHYAALHCANENPASSIIHCNGMSQFPEADLNQLPCWLGIVELFLKKDNAWRKQLTKNEGFPALAKNHPDKLMKEIALDLIESFSDNESLRHALEALRYLPAYPIDETQWNLLSTLQALLQITVAQLKLVFQKYGKIDYIENALAALHALGSDTMPTDIALALDNRIHHILVDEFQDTSSMQYRLLKALTAGWAPLDGRTLFVVGDPMQSIYRFREAEVGLFIKAKQSGIGSIPLEYLSLSVNFRSVPGVVNWVNEHFSHVFPAYEDISTGAVTYSKSTARKENDTAHSVVELYPFIDGSPFLDQSKKIVELIKQAKMERPEGSIAILVRTRSHLKAIIPALKSASIAYRAIKIDPLSQRPIIQDLLSLTRALLHPADRIAWLALLRAPWCGLSLKDLLTLSHDSAEISLYAQLQSSEIKKRLTPEGQERIQRIVPILIEKISNRRRLSLRVWIESTWILLGGPATAEQASDLDDAAAYFSLLEKLDHGSDLLNTEILTNAVDQLFATPDNQADNSVQIMTIHNSKGLEFDTVIIPHLESSTLSDEKQLLLWLERPRQDSETDLIIAPIAKEGQKNTATYDYIRRQIKLKSDYEDARLLYVAATRAKQGLHLLFSIETDKTPTQGLLGKLWPAIHTQVENTRIDSDTKINKNNLENSATLKRLTKNWKNPVIELSYDKKLTELNNTNEFLLPDHMTKTRGTLIHRIIQQLGLYGISWWTKHNNKIKTDYIKNQLIQAGINRGHLLSSVEKIKHCIEQMIQDERGQWILSSHTSAASEYAITTIINNEIESFIIDRTFIDEKGVRWIIDFKTTEQEMDNILIYKKQLSQYAAAFKNLGENQIKSGIYFPMTTRWVEL